MEVLLCPLLPNLSPMFACGKNVNTKLLCEMMGLTTSKFRRRNENLAAISWRGCDKLGDLMKTALQCKELQLSQMNLRQISTVDISI